MCLICQKFETWSTWMMSSSFRRNSNALYALRDCCLYVIFLIFFRSHWLPFDAIVVCHTIVVNTYTIFISILLFCCVTIDTIKIVKQTYCSNKKKSNNVLIQRRIHAFACIHLKAFILDILVTITINRKSIQ